ncbi:MAG: hypothetical protein ACLR2E_19885 [Lachnospiraceae bacterium]
MHDKYLIIDDTMYLLGGRNSNDIFLGDRKTGINADREIFVYEPEKGNGKVVSGAGGVFCFHLGGKLC